MDDLVMAAINGLAAPGLSIAQAATGVPRGPGSTPSAADRPRGPCSVWVNRPTVARCTSGRQSGASLVATSAPTSSPAKPAGRRCGAPLAGLLATHLELHAQPRTPSAPGYFDRFGLDAAGDARLTAWMVEHLRLAVWPSPPGADLGVVETAVLIALVPPLNLSKVRSPWRGQVTAGRNTLASEARTWTPS